MIYLHVALGGVLGALARYAAGVWITSAGASGFPWATLSINVAGSLLLGILVQALPEWGAPAEVRALLTIGFCGSFTTFSTFGYETVTLVQNGSLALAGAYVLSSVLLGLAGVVAGLWVGGVLA